MNCQFEQSELSSSDDQDIESQLNQRLLQNYRKIKDSIRKQEPESNRVSNRSVQKAIEVEQQKNLETRMVLTEKQYSKARENNILLLKKLSEAEEYSQFLKFQIDKVKRQKSEQLSAMAQTIDRLQLEIESAKTENRKFSSEFSCKEIAILQQSLQTREKEVSRMSLKVKSLELALEERQATLRQSFGEIQSLKQTIDSMRGSFQIDQNCLHQDGGSQILQLQQSRCAIERLFSLLKHTEEYRNFFVYSKSCQDVTFLNEIVKLLPGDLKLQQNWKISPKIKEEKLLWTPSNCYKVMLTIKGKYDRLTEPCIQEILFELNKLWLQRQEQQIAKTKEQHCQDLQKIKSKYLPRYDELVARKQIERLKKQLQQLRMNKAGPSEELGLLKTIGEYEDQLRLKERENRLLSERLQLLSSQNMNYDKVLYLEGALWLIDKVLDEVSLFQEDLRITSHRLQIKIEENGEDLFPLFDEMSQSFGQVAISLQERLLSMKESTLKKINNQKRETVVDENQ